MLEKFTLLAWVIEFFSGILNYIYMAKLCTLIPSYHMCSHRHMQNTNNNCIRWHSLVRLLQKKKKCFILICPSWYMSGLLCSRNNNHVKSNILQPDKSKLSLELPLETQMSFMLKSTYHISSPHAYCIKLLCEW